MLKVNSLLQIRATGQSNIDALSREKAAFVTSQPQFATCLRPKRFPLLAGRNRDQIYYFRSLPFSQASTLRICSQEKNATGQDQFSFQGSQSTGPLQLHAFRRNIGERIDAGCILASFIVLVADVLADAVAVQIFTRVDEPGDMLYTALGFFAAYVIVDLVSALYNWHTLNYAKQNQDSSINKASFSRLVAPHCAVVSPFFLYMLVSPPGSLWADTFLCYFLTFFHLASCDKRNGTTRKKDSETRFSFCIKLAS